jgi:uncharacterized protein (TIGR00730 family)
VRIAVYCGSSRRVPELYHEAARRVGAALARSRHTMVYGGGRTGLMGSVADAALAGGGVVEGVILDAFVGMDVHHRGLHRLDQVSDMRARKRGLEERADAFIALPGGIGTLEEFFEAWTAGYLGMHDKPVVMLDPFGHYTGLLTWLYGLIDSGYVAQRALDRLVVVDDVDAALAACEPRR